MNETSEKFCPNCGQRVESTTDYCPNCGTTLNTEQAHPSAGESRSQLSQAPYTHGTEPHTSEDNTWQSIEKYVAIAGKFSWILLLLYVIITFIDIIGDIIAIVTLGTSGLGLLIAGMIWQIITLIAVGIIGYYYVYPFAKRCDQKDWYFIVNDVVLIEKYRVPKILLVAIILEIFTYAWGGLVLLIVVLLIIFMGPEEVYWKVEDMPSNP